jgi:5-methylcytosine-specific restriction endonuclease McrA
MSVVRDLFRPQTDRVRSSLEERKALRKMKTEARANGATLSRPGHGGLPNSLVLTVLRRDQYRCKVHGDAGEGSFGGLRLHHKGGLDNPVSTWLKLKGKSNDANNLVTVCARGHDEIHARDRSAQ